MIFCKTHVAKFVTICPVLLNDSLDQFRIRIIKNWKLQSCRVRMVLPWYQISSKSESFLILYEYLINWFQISIYRLINKFIIKLTKKPKKRIYRFLPYFDHYEFIIFHSCSRMFIILTIRVLFVLFVLKPNIICPSSTQLLIITLSTFLVSFTAALHQLCWELGFNPHD